MSVLWYVYIILYTCILYDNNVLVALAVNNAKNPSRLAISKAVNFLRPKMIKLQQKSKIFGQLRFQ